jgi:hypothetical protein
MKRKRSLTNPLYTLGVPEQREDAGSPVSEKAPTTTLGPDRYRTPYRPARYL